MRKYALLAAAAGLAVSGSLARADFVVNSTRTPLDTAPTAGSATMPGFDLVTFYAKNTTGSLLTAAAVSLTDKTGSNLVVGYTNANETAIDFNGQSEIHTNGTKSQAPTIYVFKSTGDTTTGSPGIYSAVNVLGDATNTTEDNASNGLGVGSTTTPLTVSNSFTVTTLSSNYASTASSNGTDIGVNATTANGGLGALIGLAVVPHGDVVEASGQLREGLNNAVAYDVTNPSTTVPEPASLGMIGVGIVGLMARRRRRM